MLYDAMNLREDEYGVAVSDAIFMSHQKERKESCSRISM